VTDRLDCFDHRKSNSEDTEATATTAWGVYEYKVDCFIAKNIFLK